jgi:LmbE family N-acetylglucosaminyl deacetylase
MRQFRLGEPGRPLQSILCIGAHCDDIEIGCGGTLLQLCRQHPGLRVDWFIAVAPKQRAEESRQAAGRLLQDAGSYSLDLHDFPDGHLPYCASDVKNDLRALASGINPDIVLTHTKDDAHQDHRFLAELTWQTFRDHVVVEYEIPKYDGDLGRPNWFVPLAHEAVDRKVNCLLECFPTQRGKPWFDADTFRGLMRLRGMECRSPSGFAEAFHLRKGIWLSPEL